MMLGLIADIHADHRALEAALSHLDRLKVSSILCAGDVVGYGAQADAVVEVLRAQTQDAREESKRGLIESAGRKEVAMLVPLVFLILPVTIAFAVFPATLVLDLGF